MKNVFIWINEDFKFGGAKRYSKSSDIGERYLKLQIENSLRLGWRPEDIIIGTNFPFRHGYISSYLIPVFATHSAFANKMPALQYLIDNLPLHDDLYVHDCDVFQLIPFSFPKVSLDVGMVRHSLPGRGKPQGGVIFFRKTAYDIIRNLANEIIEKKVRKEESFLPGFYKRSEYINRKTWLDYRWNMFRQSDFRRKYKLAKKPIILTHFHPEYESTWEAFVEGNNVHNVKIVTPELKELMIKYKLYPDKEKYHALYKTI